MTGYGCQWKSTGGPLTPQSKSAIMFTIHDQLKKERQ